MSRKIFIVEDDVLTAEHLKQHIEQMGCQFSGMADNAETALEQIRQTRPDLVLMDIRLKGNMDDIEVAAKLHADDNPAAVIYLTAYADEDILARAKLTGPLAYLVKPFTIKELHASIETGLYRSEMERKQLRILDGVVKALAELVRLHSPFLRDAQIRVATLSAAIANRMQIPAQEVKGIRIAAMLHGVGMLTLPTDLMDSYRYHLQGETKAQFQKHPEVAWRLLKDIEFLYPVAEVVHQHMERLDGSGYPRGLKGNEINSGARILAVACEVARLLRPHGNEPAHNVEDALKELEAGSGTLFDARVVEACVQLLRDKGFNPTDILS